VRLLLTLRLRLRQMRAVGAFGRVASALRRVQLCAACAVLVVAVIR
jgi:hypothetical protein